MCIVGKRVIVFPNVSERVLPILYAGVYNCPAVSSRYHVTKRAEEV